MTDVSRVRETITVSGRPSQTPRMRSYSALFRTREFTPFFLSTALSSAASTIGGLALATLTYRATGSPLLSALSMFGPQLAQVVGATTLLSASDRLPPRATLTGIALAFALGTAAMATPGLPIGGYLRIRAPEDPHLLYAGASTWGFAWVRIGPTGTDEREGRAARAT